jgi:hypothetical protein
MTPVCASVPLWHDSNGHPLMDVNTTLALLRSLADVMSRTGGDPGNWAEVLRIEADALECRAIEYGLRRSGG